MTIGPRRVVTTHDAAGRAAVLIDDICPHETSNRPGMTICNLWSTSELPVDNLEAGDTGGSVRGTVVEGGSVFRLIEFRPGVAPRVHATQTIDYAVVISGEIDMELEPGEEVKLRAGDVLVQRGTVHNWNNRSNQPCLMAFVMLAAAPVVIGGLPVRPHG
jgi:quercetin dioxygenase-like cupin family protein